MERNTMIEEVNKFIDDLLSVEYATFISMYTEKDQKKYLDQYEKLKNFYVEYVSHEGFIWDREEHEVEEMINNRLDYTGKKIKRTCFQIKEYDNEEYGKIYRCYIGMNTKGLSDFYINNYWQNYFVAKVAGQYKIVSKYILKKRIDEMKKLSTDLNKSWHHIDSDEFKALGKPTAILKIESPTHPVEIAEYNAE